MQLVQIKNKENALGGRLINDGKQAVVAIKEGGNTVIEIIEVVSDVVGEIIEHATPLFHQLKAFFDDIFNTLPTYIIKDGVRYRLTLQPAGGKETDFVSYLAFDYFHLTFDVLFKTDGQNLAIAKNEMHKQLKSLDYII